MFAGPNLGFYYVLLCSIMYYYVLLCSIMFAGGTVTPFTSLHKQLSVY